MQNRFILTPFFLDQPRDALRDAAQADWHINTPALPEGETQTRMSAIHEPLAQFVAQTAGNGARPVSLAGDCCATIGVVAGLQRAGVKPTLLWLDAHGDFNTWETTPSGFLGGMPLAMLVGRGEQTMLKAIGVNRFPEERVMLSDPRDLDPDEKVTLNDSGVHQYWRPKNLVGKRTARHAALYPFRHGHCEPRWTRPPKVMRRRVVRLRMRWRHFFARYAQTKNIVAVSMCAWNPDLDKDGKTQKVSMRLFETLVGERDK